MQTNYSEFQGQAVVGMVANQEPSRRLSRVIQDAAGVGFGKAVFRGATAAQVTGTPTADKFVGITIADITQDGDLYPRYVTAGVLNEGVIWVRNGAGAVTHGDPVFVNAAGAFVNAAGAGIVAIPGATFETSAAAAALVAVRLK